MHDLRSVDVVSGLTKFRGPHKCCLNRRCLQTTGTDLTVLNLTVLNLTEKGNKGLEKVVAIGAVFVSST